MIDFEDNVVDYLSRSLEKEFPNINVTSEFSINDESTFPTVLVYEMDNYTYTPTLDSSLRENHARCVYQIEVYTKGNRSKSKAKKILSSIDSLLELHGFIRQIKTRMKTGYTDMTRYVARYQALISKDGLIYR